MKIISKEVRTTYEIMFDINEYTEIVKSFRDSMKKHHTPKAFEWLKYDEIDIDNKPLDEWHLKNLWNCGNGDTFRYIANYFGFDGWSNAGIYYDHHKCHKMTVYNYGNDF